MKTPVVRLQILTPETAQLPEVLGNDLQVRKRLIQGCGIQRLLSGLSQGCQHQDLLAFVLQILFQLCRQLCCCDSLLIRNRALVSREATPQGCPDVDGE